MLSHLNVFLKSKTFLYNLLVAVVVIGMLLFSVDTLLRSLTHHGENITVPNIRGLKIDQIEKFLTERHLLYRVVDSIYETDKPPGTVLEQDPAANSKVKEGRTLYLTVNSVQPPKVKMPNLVDVSFRQADAILQTYGLKVGKLIYKFDLAKNAVLDQYYQNRPIKTGTEIFKGSAIDLVLGNGMGNTKVTVPDLNGLTRGEAVFVLKGSSLNLGIAKFDPDVSDSSTAKVYRQSPPAGESDVINQGDAVDIFLK